MTVFLAELKPATAENEIPSQWEEFWAEFKLGAKVFAGFETPVPHAQKQSA